MTVRITTPAAQTSASANLDSSSPRHGEAGKQTPASGALSSIRGRVAGWLSLLTINRVVIITSLLISLVVLKPWRYDTVIDTINVPKDLEADGYTPATMSQRIKDAVTQINRDATLTKRIGIFRLSELDPLHPDSADYESPGRGHSWDSGPAFTLTSDDLSKKYDISVGGVSLTSVILYLRELFGVSDTRISGEITAEHPSAAGAGGKDEKSPPKKFSIRLRISDKGHVQYEAEADKLETLVEQAALKLVERLEPLDAAYYSYHKRDFDNALRIVRAYLLADQTKKERQWALNLLGLIEHARNRSDDALAEKGYDEAIAVFEKLRARDPDFAPAFYNHSYVLIDKGRKHLEDPDRKVARELFSQAYEIARKGIEIDKAKGTTAREQAAGYATAGRAAGFLGKWEPMKYKEALGHFDSSIEADPMFIYAYFAQGAIHIECKEHDNAVAKYQLATEISPSAQTFTRAGAYLRRHEWHADSIPMFRKAADLKPSANAYTYWGMALRDLGKHDDEARDLFQKAIATDETSPNGYNQLGLLYLEEEKWDEAADNFNLAIKYSPEWSNYHYNLGVALRRSGKPEQAKSAFEKAIALYQSHAGSRAALDELDQSHPKARMELEELERPEGPPKVDQTTVGRKTSEETLTLSPLPAGGG
jgi:tetratricopeptide (TPR) repeat protein